jgi:pimeloyl-ACP methyl ester carboxylesterase
MRQVPPRPETAGSLDFSEDGATSTIARGAMERVFYNSSPPALVARARKLSCAEPMASFTTPLAASEERWGKVPRFYIECTQDRAISPELQERMRESLPCRRTFSMNTDHSPFYSAPAELARHLLAVAEEVSARP